MLSQPYEDVLRYNSESDDFHIDTENLKKYAKFYIKILRNGKKVEKQTILRSDMVQCDKEMFKALGEEEISDEILKRRLCPDMNSIQDILRVKNKYTDKDERVSFSMQAVSCDRDIEDCADPDSIEKFFEDIYFTLYILKENIAFGDISNIGKRPVSVND